ncbi:MAG: glutaminyl-peptide cyclotransferase, partial [Deltaproteobacteria bacterium]|nr:glutaminyl-peptide cyclotransferase [Deltaproteobacteria bacterium]
MNRPRVLALAACAALLALGGSLRAQLAAESPAAALAPPTYQAVVEETRLKPAAFTQGLVFFDGLMHESSGLYGRSRLRSLRLPALAEAPLEVAAEVELPKTFFAEGLAADGQFLYLLTWREGVVVKFDPQSLTSVETFFFPAQSWGLTWDGERLWRSDGTQRLQRHQADNFQPVGPALTVRDGLKTVQGLNELEWDPVHRLILANVWGDDRIAAIDPETGQVRFWLDCSAFAVPERRVADDANSVLNGLAFDGQGRLWATGKFWPRLYRLFYGPPEALAGRTA